MFTNPTTPNPADFLTFVLAQGVPSSDFPSGALSGASVSTSGALTATAFTGTVTTGMALVVSTTQPYFYLTAWDASTLSGTVSPIPSTTLSDVNLSVYTPSLLWALQYAVDHCLKGSGFIPVSTYLLAAYNLGMHQLLKIATDIPGQTFFSGAREQYKLLSFTGGVISSASDQNTASTIAVPDLLKDLNLSNLDLLKTPWGREYLGYAMNFGPYVVGMS